ncbi:hypothetical protein GCM10017083_34250 [Thalassobaculum fulvum]|uniref:PAS domain-containing protein n=1 Tax=Thalassobaculum fulvum TaxID=1633335 RepID=A0A919CR09_9PROT|nr:PAS domain-containing protein [Thalassobaculum fulvum]GHD55393.1 hypothetical protein GCM10017083_34250 [Thalassobaculum fulvum]
MRSPTLAPEAFWRLPSIHVEIPIAEIADYPLLAECLKVWRNASTGRLPETLDPLTLPVAVIKGVSLLRKNPDSGDWIVDLGGSLLTDGHGREMKGTGLSEGFAPGDVEKVREGIERAMARGEPELMRREFQDPHGQMWSFVRLLLPLSSDGVKRDRYAMIIDPETYGRPVID